MTERPLLKGSARDRAAGVLTACYDGRLFCQDLLEEMRSAGPLSPADEALAAELVLGVSRHRITAEHLAAHFYQGRWAGLRIPVRVLLAMAVYQLCWLDRVPDHAAVDQAVRQARHYGKATAAMVNALLRRAAQCRGDVIARPDAPDPRRYLPLDDDRGRLFSEDVFPDPARRPLEHMVAITSHPPYLVERWHRRFKPKLCRQICDAGGRRPPLVLRPNRLRIAPERLIERLRAAGRDACRVDGTDAVLLRDGSTAADLPEVQEGLCQPQDSTSQAALLLDPPRAGEFVLDLCAGAGTKSTHAAELMNDTGLVIATDADADKLAKIASNAERLGLSIIQTVPIDQLGPKLNELGRPLDLILIDAPCTNTGVLARRPEARYRAAHKALLQLVDIQKQLLVRAAELAGPATRLIYATCSLEREENQGQVEAFCAARPEWRVEKQAFTLPDRDRDGGYAALLTWRSPSARG